MATNFIINGNCYESNNDYAVLLTKKQVEAIARNRMEYLFNLSLSTGNERYIVIMENIAKRMDITLPPEIKRLYCKKCKKPYINPKIRIKRKLITVTCANCGDIRRFTLNH